MSRLVNPLRLCHIHCVTVNERNMVHAFWSAHPREDCDEVAKFLTDLFSDSGRFRFCSLSCGIRLEDDVVIALTEAGFSNLGFRPIRIIKARLF